MKNASVFPTLTVAMVAVLALSLTSCRKTDEVGYRYDLPEGVQKIVPEALLDTLIRKGMVIHEGLTPPTLNGVFRISPFELVTPYGPEDGWQRGKVVADYKYRFYDQSTDKQSLKIDSKQPSGSDAATGLGAFVAGQDNSFTIFAEVAGQTSGATYKQLAVISGEWTAQGLRNFQYAFIMKEKNDPGTKLISVGKARVWKDGDGTSPSEANFRLAAEDVLRQTGAAPGLGSQQ